MRKKKKNYNNIILSAILILLVVITIEMALLLADRFGLINNTNNKNEGNLPSEIIEEHNSGDTTDEEIDVDDIVNKKDNWLLSISEDYETIYNPGGNKGYRYGPSIMKHGDGTVDMWMSRPGNNSTQWDYIAYRHYDGENWSDEDVVLWPTPGSKDQCSCCDPAVIYVNDYYYLGYTATASSELNGMNNSAFVARSKYPDGPFEKWNGSSWGGDPEPIIEYDNNPNFWGIGEISFVADNEDLFIYYTFINDNDNCVRLAKADFTDNWPETLRLKNTVLDKQSEDSFDIVYDEYLDTYLAFSIRDRMTEGSGLVVSSSPNGKEFIELSYTSNNMKNYSHNMGVSKDEKGHVNTKEPLIIGYAYGEEWGSWPMILQEVKLTKE